MLGHEIGEGAPERFVISSTHHVLNRFSEFEQPRKVAALAGKNIVQIASGGTYMAAIDGSFCHLPKS